MIGDKSNSQVDSIQRATEEDRGLSTRREYLKFVTVGAATTVVLPNATGTASAASNSRSDPSPSNSPVGGGTEYEQTVSGGDYTVTTREGLIDAIETADSGEIVYVPNDAQINLGTRTNIQIGKGVTLASGRGIDGARGGLLYTNAYTGDDQPAFFEINSRNVRITGLRFQGPQTTTSILVRNHRVSKTHKPMILRVWTLVLTVQRWPSRSSLKRVSSITVRCTAGQTLQ